MGRPISELVTWFKSFIGIYSYTSSVGEQILNRGFVTANELVPDGIIGGVWVMGRDSSN